MNKARAPDIHSTNPNCISRLPDAAINIYTHIEPISRFHHTELFPLPDSFFVHSDWAIFHCLKSCNDIDRQAEFPIEFPFPSRFVWHGIESVVIESENPAPAPSIGPGGPCYGFVPSLTKDRRRLKDWNERLSILHRNVGEWAFWQPINLHHR